MAKPTPRVSVKPAATKPKPAARTAEGLPAAPVRPAAVPLPSHVRTALQNGPRYLPSVQTIQQAIEEALRLLTPGTAFPQELMELSLRFSALKSAIKPIEDAIDAAALQHFKANGTFETGLFAAIIQLDKPGRKSPKWKDCACIEREALCKLQAVPFNRELYEAAVLARTLPGVSDSVTFVATA